MVSAALLALMTLPAHALSVSVGFDDARPVDGDVDVPINVRPVVRASGLTVATEADPDGEMVLKLVDVGADVTAAVTVSAIGSGLYRVEPVAELTEATEYELWAAFSEPQENDELMFITAFMTGDSVDLDRPTIPLPFAVVQSSHTDEWGDWDLFTVEQVPAVDPVGVLYEVEVESVGCSLGGDCGAAPVSYALGGMPYGEPSHDGNTQSEVLRFATDPAGGLDPLAALNPADSVVRIYTADLAGNATEMVCSIPEGVDAAAVGCADAAAVNVHGDEDPMDASDGADDDKISGCSVVTASPAVALALVSLAAVARRREDAALD